MNPYITGIISTAIFLSGAWWQLVVFEKDEDNPWRHAVASILGLTLIIGSIGYTIFAAIDPSIQLTFWGSLNFIWTAVLIAFVFFLKQALGPILISASAAWATYAYFQHGVLELIPIIRWIAKWLFTDANPKGSEMFLWLTYGYALIGSIYSTSVD